MNKVVLMGRLTRDPECNFNGDSGYARYTLAVDRRRKKGDDGNQQSADFIRCVSFGKGAEFAEKYLRQGTKIVVSGHIQTGSYTNKDGQKVYTTDVIVDEQEFAESKKTAEANGAAPASTPTTQSRNNAPLPTSNEGGWMDIPDGIDENLPF